MVFERPGYRADLTAQSALWSIVSLVMFLLSLAYLDRLEQRDKRLARIVVEQPEDLAVPIAQ